MVRRGKVVEEIKLGLLLPAELPNMIKVQGIGADFLQQEMQRRIGGKNERTPLANRGNRGICKTQPMEGWTGDEQSARLRALVDHRHVPLKGQANLAKFGARKRSEVAYLSQDVGRGDQLAKPLGETREKFKVPRRVPIGSLEAEYSIPVNRAHEQQHQEVGVDQNTFPSVLGDEGAGIQHHRLANSRIFIDSTFPDSLQIVNIL